MATAWTEEMCEDLRRMVEVDGATYGEAAVEIGVTRNAAIGRGRRMGLQTRNVQHSQGRRRPRAVTAPTAKSVIFKAPARPRKPPLEPPQCGVPFEELTSIRQCRYPHGERPPYLFCAREVVPGTSWCAGHVGLVYNDKPLKPVSHYNFR